MSAFIVGNSCIEDILAAVSTYWDTRDGLRYNWWFNKAVGTTMETKMDWIGNQWLKLNIDSVNYRYDEDTKYEPQHFNVTPFYKPLFGGVILEGSEKGQGSSIGLKRKKQNKESNMAKALQFNLNGSTFEATPVKLERKKLYGWTETVATDDDGGVCVAAQLAPGGTLVVPPGGVKPAKVDDTGCWLDRNDLTAVDADGNPVVPVQSSFDAPILLDHTATVEEFLDHVWKSVYQLDNAELAAKVGNDIYAFPFSYRGGVSADEGYLQKSGDNLFLFTGEKVDFEMIGVKEEAVLDDEDTPADEEETDELDFSMM